MVGSSSTLCTALDDLLRALDAPPRGGLEESRWRWAVRQRMASVRDALATEDARAADTWLAPRGGTAHRERNVLLTRLAVLGPRVLEDPDVEPVRASVRRLVADVQHHRQRVHDLAYDDVSLELGGSE